MVKTRTFTNHINATLCCIQLAIEALFRLHHYLHHALLYLVIYLFFASMLLFFFISSFISHLLISWMFWKTLNIICVSTFAKMLVNKFNAIIGNALVFCWLRESAPHHIISYHINRSDIWELYLMKEIKYNRADVEYLFSEWSSFIRST